MAKGRHLLIDCTGVPPEVCGDDKLVLRAMATAAERAGATVISQVRYHFGHNSAPGFTAMVLLDESHCSAHAYSDEGLLALDIFTCGNTDPRDVLAYMQEMLDLGDITVQHCERFHLPGERFRAPEIAVSLKAFRTETLELAANGNGHD